MRNAPQPLTVRATPAGPAAPPPTSGDVAVTLPRRLRPTQARDAASGAQPVAVAPDEIARVELDNGFVVWSRADDLLRDRGRKTVSRSDGSEAWEIDTAPRTDAGPIDGSELGGAGDARGAERGALSLGIRLLDFFGVDLKQKSAAAFGETFEKRRLRGATPGLLHRLTHAPGTADPLVVTPLSGAAPADAAPADAAVAGDSSGAGTASGQRNLQAAIAATLPADRPLLVFLHGTMSSVACSFGDLWAAPSDAAAAAAVNGPAPSAASTSTPTAGADMTALQAAAAARDAIARRYGEHVYAFEHRSLTESPIRNALDLARQLPVGAQLHLVSHSRGGLVGELLCLAERDRTDDPLRTEWLDELFAADRTVAEAPRLGRPGGPAATDSNPGYPADRQALRELLDELSARQIRVRRFVRVACPARGTTLASGRLDRWLSVFNVLTGNGLVNDVADFLLAVVKERTDPRVLPGLEAMMPGSALTRLLQAPGLVTAADLSAVSGDLEPAGRWGQLKVLAVDWFYGADHDLVVNTGSMVGGIRRPVDCARFQRDQGDKVTHFNYFANPKSVRWLIGGLTRADNEDGGFRPIAEAKQEEPRWRAAVRASRDATAPRPIAVLVPGTMGSALTVGGQAVWLDYGSLLRGGLASIGWDATDVEPTTLLDQFYGPLLEYLARTHQVEILAYDWRQSVREAAKKLTDKLAGLLPTAERTGQPVHLVAHSMGGLVSRAMIADGGAGTQVWRRMLALSGSRLLMLGTPNLGSYEAVRWLTGFNPTQAKLTLLDLRHGVNAIIDIVRRFPGLVELLPFADPHEPFAEAATWAALKANLSAGWKSVDDDTLRTAVATWALLRGAPADVSRMVYVAGCQKATVIGHRVVDDDLGYGTTPRRVLEWIATAEGDGTVSWASGRLSGVPTYYAANTAHDELCSNTDDSRVFRGYHELLTTGKTDQLSNTPPATARAAAGEPATFVLPPAPVADAIPDEEQLRSLSFSGGRPRKPRDAARAISSTIDVSICHGDLSYARHAVLVGHYTGDTIVSAELALDRRLQGALSRRRDLGLYPGPLGSHAVFLDERLAFDGNGRAGALVVGLGQVGELTPGRLETGVRDTLLDYALRLAHQPLPPRAVAGAAPVPRRVRVSCLLVGTGAGGLRVADSIESTLRGALAANRRLEDARFDQRVLIDQIEFLELWEDMAINAARDLGRVLRNDELGQRIQWPTHCILEGQGRMRRRSFDVAGDWWQRLEIVEEAADDSPGAPARLRFIATTDRARAEQTLAQGQLQLVDAFIQQACASATQNAEVARTLFEMLMPVALKQAAPDQRDLVLLVDETSARFPWELLENRWSHTGRPQSVATGMVRQLKVRPGEFRVDPRHAHDNSVFIVGNPDLGGWSLFPDLPGARREAQTVQHLFSDAGHPATACIDQKATDILSGLHTRAWRVLHLAGHGEHEFELPAAAGSMPVAAVTANGASAPATATAPGRRVSGMVIGQNTFLTPGDIEQMRFVPELVFINCCHLGQTRAATVGSGGAAYNRLAANLGVEFIRMGVKAVVAAGWAVDDGAADTFAQTFYNALLGGDTFGRAVRFAREATWDRHRGANTWGAYQCYGDPGWRLDRPDGTPDTSPAAPYVLANEWVADLLNLAEQLRVTAKQPGDDDGRATERLLRQIDALQNRVPDHRRKDWEARADVAAAIGFAYGEGGLFEKAVGWLDKSLASKDGDTPVRAVEQCANMNVRVAAGAWAAALLASTQGGSGGSEAGPALEATRQGHVGTITKAIRELSFINERAENVERLCLLGAAYKRLAWVAAPGKEREEALGEMVRHYQRAVDLTGKSEPINRYAFCNAAFGRLLGHDGTPSGDGRVDDWRSTLADQCVLCEQQALAESEEEPKLWTFTSLGDVNLVRLLLASASEAAEINTLAAAVNDRYATALERGASARERSSLRENVEFLIAMGGAWRDEMREALAGIGQRL